MKVLYYCTVVARYKVRDTSTLPSVVVSGPRSPLHATTPWDGHFTNTRRQKSNAKKKTQRPTNTAPTTATLA